MKTEDEHIYSYDPEQFVIQTKIGDNSQFDVKLKTCWQEKMVNNCFRYNLDHIETRCIPGKYGFIAQLNIKRALERRKPEFMSDIIMPFNPEKFHFGKIDKKEILIELLPLHWETNNSNQKSEVTNRNVLIINVSPIECCNSLLVPSIEKGLPQVLNFDGLRLAIETVLMSSNPTLKLGLNSLGGYASVNHLHFHIYYLQEILYLQHAPVKHLIDDCYEMEDFPSEGFAFQLIERDQVLSTTRSVLKLVEYLQKEKIAHNIFMTRGKAFTDFTSSTDKNEFNAVRIFVWARNSSFGSKDDMQFNLALCELAGHLPIKDRNYFENVTEEEVANLQHDVCHKLYLKVKKDVTKIYK